jgi:hypothetical protein
MCTHTIPPGKFSADQLKQFAQAAAAGSDRERIPELRKPGRR